MSNEYLLKIKDSTLNIKQPCLANHVTTWKNNLLHLLNYRNQGILIGDSPLVKLTGGDFTYRYRIPIFTGIQYLNIFLHGLWWVYSESGSSTHNLTITAKNGGGAALDARTILIPDNVDAVATYYDGNESSNWVRLDVSAISTTSLEVEVLIPDDMFFGSIAVFAQGESTIDYNDYNDINGIGTIHDEGISALSTALTALKAYPRIINNWSRNRAAITSTTGVDLMKVDVPIMGKQFGSDVSEVFSSWIYVSAISGTLSVKAQIRELDGTLHWEDSYTSYNSTGWKKLVWTAADHAFDRDFSFDYYYNLVCKIDSGLSSATVQSISTYC